MNWRIYLLSLLFFSFWGSRAGAQTPTVGVIDAQLGMAPGYVLFAHTGSNAVYLIDNCGQVINQWNNSLYTPGSSIYLLEDGSLLKTCRIQNANFIMGGVGGRVERWSWNDSLMWAYDHTGADFTQHHDIEPLPNGNVILLAVEAISGLELVQEGRDPATVSSNTVWSEYLLELRPLGADSAEIVWEWHAWDHLVQDYDAQARNFGVIADHPERIDLNFSPGVLTRDWLHANSVAYNPYLDQLMLSLAHFDEVWIIDHSTTSAEAASSTGGNSGRGGDLLYRWGNPLAYQRGDSLDKKLGFQHDAHWICAGRPDSGKVMIFNNGVGRAYSSVEIITLPETSPGVYHLPPNGTYGPLVTDRTWTADTANLFFSKIMSGASQQPNGNLLISHGANGYSFEIDLADQQVWRYQSPVTGNGITPQGTVPPAGSSSVFRMRRYGPDYPGLQGQNLTPGAAIEPGSDLSDCLAVLTDRPKSTAIPAIEAFPNPVRDHLYLRQPSGKPVSIAICDPYGKVLFQGTLRNTLTVSTQSWPAGVYFVVAGQNGIAKLVHY
ncbi:MAG: aryl-sulfate sulfotransferase [Bacteroidota bacterium]